MMDHHDAVPMRVLVACELSGTVRRAFAALWTAYVNKAGRNDRHDNDGETA